MCIRDRLQNEWGLKCSIQNNFGDDKPFIGVHRYQACSQQHSPIFTYWGGKSLQRVYIMVLGENQWFVTSLWWLFIGSWLVREMKKCIVGNATANNTPTRTFVRMGRWQTVQFVHPKILNNLSFIIYHLIISFFQSNYANIVGAVTSTSVQLGSVQLFRLNLLKQIIIRNGAFK